MTDIQPFLCDWFLPTSAFSYQLQSTSGRLFWECSEERNYLRGDFFEMKNHGQSVMWQTVDTRLLWSAIVSVASHSYSPPAHFNSQSHLHFKDIITEYQFVNKLGGGNSLTHRSNGPWPSFRSENTLLPFLGPAPSVSPLPISHCRTPGAASMSLKMKPPTCRFLHHSFLYIKKKAYELKRVCVLPSLPSKQCCDNNECLCLRVGVSVQCERDTDMCAVFH